MNASNNSNDTSSYRMESYELIEPIPEINPNDFIYFKIEETSRIEDDFKNVNLNDYVDLNSKRLIDKYLHDLFSKRHKGKPYSRTTNNSSKNVKNEFTCFKSGFIKSMAHKSVQTNRFNMCTHKLSVKSDDKNFKHKDNKFLSTNNVNDNLLPQIISAKRIASTDNEETRKKLHITRISSNTPIFINKNNSTNSSNNEMRYINIKCNTKLQHIPISQSLNKNYLQLNQNNSTLSYSFNRNGNNCNYITKQPISSSNRNQTQELKTYSRKNDSGYLSNITSEQKYIVQHTTDKFHKIQNNITNIQKINHTNFYHRQNELKSVASSAAATATTTSNGEHIKLMATFNGTHNLSGKANIAKQEHSLFSNNNNNNCSTYMEL